MNDERITAFARKGENFIGYEKAPGHGSICCVDEGKDAWHKRLYAEKCRVSKYSADTFRFITIVKT